MLRQLLEYANNYLETDAHRWTKAMINEKSHPVAWALMLTDLEDVQEHLLTLVKELEKAGAMDDTEFAIHLGHIYAHLNRVWHARNEEQGISDKQWSDFSQFPKDVKPVG